MDSKEKQQEEFVSAEDLMKIEKENEELEKEIKILEKESESEAESVYRGVINQMIRDSRQYKLLTKEEETDLFNRYNSGDESAREMIYNCNYRLVLSVARRYWQPSLGESILEDYFQEGCIGLGKAIDRFDVTMGFKFSTYATWWISQAITRYISNNSIIRVPVHVHEKLRRYNKWIAEYTKVNGEFPSTEECKLKMQKEGLNEDTYFAYNTTNNVVSLNIPVSPDGDSQDTELGDLISADTESVESLGERQALAETINSTLELVLTEKEIYVLKQRYYEGKTLEQVGRTLHVTRERVRQIESKALRRLRFSRRSRHLRDIREFINQ